MHFNASAFLQKIEQIKLALTKLDAGIVELSQAMILLRGPDQAVYRPGSQLLNRMDAALIRIGLSHAVLLETVDDLLPSSGRLVLAPTRDPLETLGNAAITLTIIRNAMHMLAEDHEENSNLKPLQQELFAKSYARIADVVEALCAAHRELMGKGV